MSWHETEDNSGQYELNNIWSVGKNAACIQMAGQCMDKRVCAGVFPDRDLCSEQAAEVPHSYCGLWCLLRAVQAAQGPCSGQLPWAQTWVWSLAQLKVCYLLFACRSLFASYIMGGRFVG